MGIAALLAAECLPGQLIQIFGAANERFGVGFALLLPLLLGLDGVLCSMPVSDALTFLISAAAIVHTCRKLQ